MLVNFMDILSILLPFGIFCCHLGIFFPFWHVVPRKIWQPCLRACDEKAFANTLSSGTWDFSHAQHVLILIWVLFR
jgi:hypothetical protein